MTFEEARNKYSQLRARYEAGALSADAFESAVLEIQVRDGRGNLWQIGVQSGAWYRLQNNEWVEDSPPQKTTSATAPTQSATPTPRQEPSQTQVVPRKKIPTWIFALAGLTMLGLGAFCVLLFVLPQFITFPSASPTLASALPTAAPKAIEPTKPVAQNLSQPSMDELYAAAKAEGALTVIALPHDWCNYGKIIDEFKTKYPGIQVNELNPDAVSEDEIEAIKAGKNNNGSQAPDVVDIGLSYGEPNENLFMPYKVSNWNSIPNGTKSPDGYWYGNNYSVMGFLVNTDVQPSVPQDWNDLLNPKYKGQVALSGDPRVSNQAIQAVQAAALANGGSLDNIATGLEFFSKLNAAGHLIPFVANNDLVAKGEVAIRIIWDSNALYAMDYFNGNPKTVFVVPKTGQIGIWSVQAISAYAPHPNAAKLWVEFLYSDQAQLLYAKGDCHPIREADMRARGVIPPEISTRLPNVPGVVFPTAEQMIGAKEFIAAKWDEVVGVDIKKAE